MIDGLTGERLLEIGDLTRLATTWTGMSDFGSDDFEKPLQLLLDSLNRNPILSNGARSNLNLFLTMQLIGRLYSERGWKDNPACLDDDVSAPLIITGIVRSGSTALHRLLALDPQFQTLEHWLSRIPMPRPPRKDWPAVREYQLCAGILDEQVGEQPILQIAHLMGDPGDAEESQSLMSQSFASVTFGNLATVPEYDEWFWAADQRPAYRRFADNLRLIGSTAPNRTWLLKNPGDALALDAVLEVFPNARIIQTHRSPMEAMPSLCSMMTGFRALFESADFDRAALGRRSCEEWALAVDRMAATRDALGQPERFVDIEFHAFRRDPMSAVDKIYDRFGLQLHTDVRRQMEAWVAETSSGDHTRHDYALDQFGLSEDYIRKTYARYFDILKTI